MKTDYKEFRQIIAQVNDCSLAFLANEKFDIHVNVTNFKSGEEIMTGVSVLVFGERAKIEAEFSFRDYRTADENWDELRRLWDFVKENTEG